METQLLLPERGTAAQIFCHVYCGQTAVWMKLVLGMVVGLIPGDFVLDGEPVSSPKGAEPPLQFSAHFCCDQTAGCIQMPLGMDVGLSPGDFVLDGDPVPLTKSPPPKKKIRPMFIVAKRLDGLRCHLAQR